MPEIMYDKAGTVTIDGKSYQLVRPQAQQGQPSPMPYKIDNSNEPPWEFRLPDILSEKSLSWDQGGLKSYQGTEQVDTRFTILPPVNISEYGINTDGRWPRRLVPGPAINDFTLAGNTSSINHIWVSPPIGLSYLFFPNITWCVAGNSVWISPGANATGFPYKAYTDSSNPPIMGVWWQNECLLVTTNSNLYKATANQTNSIANGAGGVTQWTPNASTNVSRIQDPIGVPDGDTTYNSSSTNGQIDTFAYTNLSLGTSDTVQKVFVFAVLRRTSTGGANPTMRGVCRISGVNYFSTAITLDSSYLTGTSYGGPFALGTFELNPATGLQWTGADVDAAEFGYELTTLGGAGTIRVTQLYITADNITWSTVDAKASWLAVGPRRLFKIYDDGTTITLKNIAPNISEITEANWGDDVIVPGTSIAGIKVPLVAYQKTAIVATDKGVHGVDDDGTGIKIIERINYSIQTMAVQDPYLYIAHGHGVSRWLPGLVQSCGIEQEIENESVVKGTVTAIAFLGKWTFIAITPPTGNNQILVGRERVSSDGQNYGPMVWDTLIETGNSETIYHMATNRVLINLVTNNFALYYEHGNNLGYCLFPETGGIPEIDSPSYSFVTSGIRYSPRYKFRDVRDKNFYKLLVRGKNNTASIFWSVAYQIDDSGSWSTTDIAGTTMVVNADTLFEYKLPVAATGQYIQFRFTYTSNDNTKRSWINYFENMAIPQGHKIQEVSFALLLADNINHSDNEIETRDVSVQYSDLETLMSSAAPIQGSGFFGNGIYLYPRDMKLLQVTQQDFHEGEQIVQVTFRIRE